MNKKLDFFATPPTHLTILPQLQASKSRHLIFNSVSKNLKVIVAENIVDICDQKFLLQTNVDWNSTNFWQKNLQQECALGMLENHWLTIPGYVEDDRGN